LRTRIGCADGEQRQCHAPHADPHEASISFATPRSHVRAPLEE
jgi:hypothetical protein